MSEPVDIVDKLRQGIGRDYWGLCDEAADEIERLRALWEDACKRMSGQHPDSQAWVVEWVKDSDGSTVPVGAALTEQDAIYVKAHLAKTELKGATLRVSEYRRVDEVKP